MSNSPRPDGLVLAGGRGTRMGGIDKGLQPFADGVMATQVAHQLAMHCDRVLISCNRHIEQYRALGFELCHDLRSDYQGPLAGIEAALRVVSSPLLLVAPCDTPRLPAQFSQKLLAQQRSLDLDIVYAKAAGREHYLCALLRCELADDLGIYLDAGGRTVRDWYQRHRFGTVNFNDEIPNLNSPGAVADSPAGHRDQ